MQNTHTPRFLVTAGNTRQRIDQVRDWGNIFTGNTGFAIAKALSGIGEVDLLTSNRIHLAEAEAGLTTRYVVRAAPFATHAHLRSALESRMNTRRYDAIFMTAAVSDYTPDRVFEVIETRPGADGRETWVVRDVQAGKVKSNHRSIAIRGKQTEKLVDLFRAAWGFEGLLVKFKLEVGVSAEDLIRIGQASRVNSGADYLVANTLDMVEGPSAGAYLLSDAGNEWVPRETLARRLAALVRARVGTGVCTSGGGAAPELVTVAAL